MTPLQFVDKWRPVTLTERAAAQSHFNDLCHLFDHPTPLEDDPIGDHFTFEKGVQKSGGGDGFADVWKKSYFGWEYKKRRRNLDDALGQLARYALALENPPLHVACDTDRFRVVTAWTNTVPRSYDLSLEDILEPHKRAILEAVFYAPDKLKPGKSRADLTKDAADKFSTLTASLQDRGHDALSVAHFVNRLVFLFFAEDVGILKNNYFRRVIGELAERPKDAKTLLGELFEILSSGGRFGLDRLPHVNGGLFDSGAALDLTISEIGLLKAAGSQDWAHIDPSIFGTLFERFLDPSKRSQIGAHYTDIEKILLIIKPVLIAPLEAEWFETRAKIESRTNIGRLKGARAKEWGDAENIRSKFLERLRTLSILDPACGSGNFLYVSLQAVKDLEHKANQECEIFGLPPRMPIVGPEILHGIELNPLAAELARTTIWIGDIQWAIRNGINSHPEPILRKLETVEHRNALTTEDGATVKEAKWPPAEFIVGNPPFLGGKLLRRGLRDSVVDTLFRIFEGRVPPEADLVTYWFEKAHEQMRLGLAKRVGFVATNSIRGGANRRVVERAASDCHLFDAWSNEPWVVEGAAVRVSLLCFSTGDAALHLNGKRVSKINNDLSGTRDVTQAKRLLQNCDMAFMGDTKGGSFDIEGTLAREWLVAPLNPNGRPNSDVLKPWINGFDIVRRPRDMWIIDFGNVGSDNQAALYELPFAYALENIKAERVKNRRAAYARTWWRHIEPRPTMSRALKKLKRYIATPRVSKYRIFIFVDSSVLPDSAAIAIARDDDLTFGVLHSKFHEAWALQLGSSLEDRPRYTPTTTFETFPFPEGVTSEKDLRSDGGCDWARRVAEAAHRLNSLRNNWLNPPDMVRVVPEVAKGFPARTVARNPRAASILEARTLTNLYNERPQWLDDAHAELDCAVASAYGWPEDIDTEIALDKLLEMNRAQSAALIN